jgi:hypothetical protein
LVAAKHELFVVDLKINIFERRGLGKSVAS